MNKILSLIGREKLLLSDDISNNELELQETVSNSKFLVLGGAGSIGQAVTKEANRFDVIVSSQSLILSVIRIHFIFVSLVKTKLIAKFPLMNS